MSSFFSTQTDLANSPSTSKNHFRTVDITYIALFAALIAVCSWISIPTTIPFTLQTFAVFVCVGILGGKRGSLSVLVYILLGLVGLPVFAGFTGGAGVLLSSPGGYIIGFMFSALTMWLIMNISARMISKSKPGSFISLYGETIALAISMIAGLIICYAFGTIWFMIMYMSTSGAITLSAVLGMCVIPFIIPDLVKITVAILITNRIKKHII